jgi:hypothetical protein
MNTNSLHLALSFLIVTALVWSLSYLALTRIFGRWDLRRVKIHESGRYTWTQTVFYFNHFLREIGIDTLLAAGILWSYDAMGFMGETRLDAALASPAGLALLLFLAGTLSGSARQVGLKTSLQDLLQFRELDTVVQWGSHWQMHFLSTLALLLLAILPGTLYATASRPGLGLLALAFFGLSILFGVDRRALTHPRWILHGAREIATYGPLVLLPAFLPWLLEPPASARPSALTWLSLALLAVIAAYCLWVYRAHELDELAPSERGIVFLISSHFFEHALDVVYIGLILLAFQSI